MSEAGSKYQAPTKDQLEQRIKAADKPGQHLWIMLAAWQMVSPEQHRDGEFIMDRENLLMLNGPGCFKCEKPYSASMAKRRCLGSDALG